MIKGIEHTHPDIEPSIKNAWDIGNAIAVLLLL